ncbi:MAG: MotA/TolQ/ExbB proton channel family protein [Proteobacteria bacterium]|nr:MotA/TolQ/ExbB proton channel family protein [Pseudomonadota bacterium]MBU1714099.1 MotA/TolQ/ExbB proton channel family protein [Pseudomonadota bacterium]
MNFSVLELYDFLAKGGPVMVPLIGISLWMWVLIFERSIVFWMLKRPVDNKAASNLPMLKNIAASRKIEERLINAIAQNGCKDGIPDPSLADAYIKKEKNMLRRNLSTINILAAIAPLLGLLGTVVGMVATFDVISAFGTGNANAMAGGISTALITTQSGLLVAVPGLFMGAFLSRTAQGIAAGLDDFAGLIRRTG